MNVRHIRTGLPTSILALATTLVFPATPVARRLARITGNGMTASKKIALLALCGAFVGPAQAVPVLALSSGGETVVITDNSILDSSGLDGVVEYNGTLTGWAVIVTTGFSKPFIGSEIQPSLDLNSINVSSSSIGELTIMLTDTDFFADGLVQAFAAIEGTTDGSVIYRTYYDAANIAFSTTNLLTTLGAFSPTAFAGATPAALDPGGLYSLTSVVTIFHNAPYQETSFDAVLSTDTDGDGVLDGDDACPGTTANSLVDLAGCSDSQVDGDGDGVCNPDAPSDGPSACTGSDEFPEDPTESSDNDNDGTGDNADSDDDNDGYTDTDELACGSDPLDAASRPADSDTDGIPDCVDIDDDNDLVPDDADMCPDTVIPESAPTSSLGLNRNRWALMSVDGVFTQALPQDGSVFLITTSLTRGCSCEQIVEATGAGSNHLSRGCSTSLLLDWVNDP